MKWSPHGFIPGTGTLSYLGDNKQQKNNKNNNNNDPHVYAYQGEDGLCLMKSGYFTPFILPHQGQASCISLDL